MLILDRLLAWIVATSDNGHKFFRPVPRHRPVRDTIDLKLWLKFRQGLRIPLRTGSQKLSQTHTLVNIIRLRSFVKQQGILWIKEQCKARKGGVHIEKCLPVGNAVEEFTFYREAIVILELDEHAKA